MNTWPDKDELRGKLPGLAPATRRCLAFFTRLPAGDRARQPLKASDLAAWPLAGALIALGPALLLVVLLLAGGEPFIACAIALALLAAIQGALHEDGLADVADGLGGGKTGAEKLAIMGDSRIGTFGAVTLIFVVILKLGSLTVIADKAPAAAFGIFLMAAVLSRFGALYHWSSLPSARDEGLAASLGRPDRAALALAGLITAGLVILLTFFTGIGALLLALAGAAAAVLLFTEAVQRQLEGHTGDTIGATQQIGEVAVLAAVALIF